LGVKDAAPEQVSAWLDRAAALGSRDGARDGARPGAGAQAMAAEAASSSVVATS